jgi:hypothetical protein
MHREICISILFRESSTCAPSSVKHSAASRRNSICAADLTCVEFLQPDQMFVLLGAMDRIDGNTKSELA